MSTPITIRIGDNTLTLGEWRHDNPDLLQLLQMATTIELVLPQSPEAAEVLGRLVCCSSQAPPQHQVVNTSLISLLSRRIDDLDCLRTRTYNWCATAGLIYVWQIVERAEADLMQICPGLGAKTRADIIHALQAMGLQLNMDIRGLKSQLPKP